MMYNDASVCLTRSLPYNIVAIYGYVSIETVCQDNKICNHKTVLGFHTSTRSTEPLYNHFVVRLPVSEE